MTNSNGNYYVSVLTEFEKEVRNIRKIPKPEGKEIFIGTINVGRKEVTISVRNYSSKLSGNKSTLELFEKGEKFPKNKICKMIQRGRNYETLFKKR